MEMKEYQEDAIRKLLENTLEMLRESGDKRIVLHSPTGSGKTLMMAEFLKRLADDREFVCIWLAPGKLHEQSRDKMEIYYEDSRALICRYFSELSDRQIDNHEILFLNWESIRHKKMLIIRENEQEFYLAKVLERTREAGREIIVIIDESHRAAKSEISTDLIADIAPKLAIEVSATPESENPDALVRISLEKVKAEGMIKKSVILNEGTEKALIGDGVNPGFLSDDSTDETILKQALAKREQIATAFAAQNINVNPLLCIQLPDSRGLQNDNDDIRAVVEQMLTQNGITIANGKLAVWLANKKENLGNISRNDNAAEVMIFKQAIALGWDCPRAHILLLFRNWRSINFSVQTLGRIMRMPEPEIGHHYEDEILNCGYVYTNMPEVHIMQDVANGYIRIYDAHRAGSYDLLKLPSVHRLRRRELTRLSPHFVDLFLQVAETDGLKNKINTNAQTAQTSFISDYQTDNIDALNASHISGDVSVNMEHEKDLQKRFDDFARDNLSPYHPDGRSIGRVKKAIYEFFDGPLSMSVADYFSEIVKIVLSKDNRQHFICVLDITKEQYADEMAKRKEPLQKTRAWEIPKSITYGKNYDKRLAQKSQKSIMQPFYAAKLFAPEEAFIARLENSNNVKWWYKNGESESMYFAVPYTEDDEEKPFYVDFIVRFTDGTVGLYDTKQGITVAVAGAKSDGLLSYIKTADKKMYGGIVEPVQTGGWKIYRGDGANIKDRQSSDWEPLKI